MNKENLLTVILAVLVIISAVQALQFISLSTPAVDTTVLRPVASSGATGHVTNLPSDIDLPEMVGGC